MKFVFGVKVAQSTMQSYFLPLRLEFWPNDCNWLYEHVKDYVGRRLLAWVSIGESGFSLNN